MDQIVMTDDGAALGDLTLDLYKHHVGGFAGAIGNFQVATWRRTDIAVQMFDSACRVFLAGGHGSVVINLAGVAEELFDGELSRVGRKEERFIAELELRIYGDSPSQQERADLWNFVREARNAIKHWRDGKPTVSTDSASVLYSLTAALFAQMAVGQALSEPAVLVARSLVAYQVKIGG